MVREEFGEELTRNGFKKSHEITGDFERKENKQ